LLAYTKAGEWLNASSRALRADFRLDDQKARPVKTSASTGKTELRSNAFA
jgi:hypothetical protein